MIPHTPAPARTGPELLTPASALSLAIAALMTTASVAGLLLGATGLYGDPRPAAGVTASTAGLLVPGFLAHDLFNLVVGVPLLLLVVWLAHRGWSLGLLLWPGVLFYALYTYATYLFGAPFGPLFLVHVALVALSAGGVIVLVAGFDRTALRDRLASVVPARLVGGLLVALALLTLGQDVSGAVGTALSGTTGAEPLGRHVWSVDLAIEVPAVLVGGVLLWRRTALGYAVAAGLLLQFGLTPLALATIVALQPVLTGSPADLGTIVGVLVFAVVCFAPLGFFLRSATPASGRRLAPSAVRAGGA